jgi:CubicO group peptidase (beta-lactamase class C family)
MRINVRLLAAFTFIVLCSSLAAESPVAIQASIEEGLVAVSGLAEVFDVERTRASSRMGMAERMKHYGVPGVGIAIIEDYQVDAIQSFGVIEAGTGEAVTPETLFEAASTTKLLATVAALRLVEQGKLDLDEDLNRRLESWKIPANDFTAAQKVTLRRLLTHQAGINRPDGGFGYEDGSTPSLVQVLKGTSPAENNPAAVEFVPGSQHQYSNFGYLIIQLLLEEVVGRPYAALAHETLFEPLRMKRSTLVHPLRAEFRGKVALPHDNEGKPHERPQHPTALAQGGLVATPADLGRLTAEILRAYDGQSGRLISRSTARRMFQTEFALDPDKMMGISGQGLGVFLLGQPREGHFYFLHPGYNEPGANCFLIASPQTGKGAVIMTNGAAGLPLSLEILAAVVHACGWPAFTYVGDQS